MDIIKKLENFDSAEISDALDACGIEGALLGVKPISNGRKLIGPIFTVKYSPFLTKPETFQNAGNYIDDVPENMVILIDNEGRDDCTTWGDILTQVAIKKKIAGTVVFGSTRDVHFIRRNDYPVFASHVYMRSGKNRVYKSDQNCILNINGIKINPGDILFGDENGVLIIPIEYLDEVIEKARNIHETEKKIIESIKNGNSLKKSREIYQYDQPWVNENVAN